VRSAAAIISLILECIRTSAITLTPIEFEILGLEASTGPDGARIKLKATYLLPVTK
jgi:hypothetical protein